jgi:hypothetical protein
MCVIYFITNSVFFLPILIVHLSRFHCARLVPLCHTHGERNAQQQRKRPATRTTTRINRIQVFLDGLPNRRTDLCKLKNNNDYRCMCMLSEEIERRRNERMNKETTKKSQPAIHLSRAQTLEKKHTNTSSFLIARREEAVDRTLTRRYTKDAKRNEEPKREKGRDHLLKSVSFHLEDRQ